MSMILERSFRLNSCLTSESSAELLWNRGNNGKGYNSGRRKSRWTIGFER